MLPRNDTQQTPKAKTEYCDQIKTQHSRKIKEMPLLSAKKPAAKDP